MTAFENYLIEKGYLKFRRNHKGGGFVEEKKLHIISSVSNLSYFYIHESEKNLIQNMISGFGVADGDPKKIIEFGLCEAGFGPTLIQKRPLMLKDGYISKEREKIDILLMHGNFDDILSVVHGERAYFKIVDIDGDIKIEKVLVE